MKTNYELTFWGGVTVRYRRNHSTLESAVATAQRVLAGLESRAAHPAIIYGPGCGKDGKVIH